MSKSLEQIIVGALSLSDWASIATMLGVALALIGLYLVWVQIRSAAKDSRAGATILFQERFKESRPARHHVIDELPIHESLLTLSIEPGEIETAPYPFKTWLSRAELSEEDRQAATAVVNALNDVAQYVVDGLRLRSALQQYHTIFIRAGAALIPYLEQINEPVEGGKQIRLGRRIPILYNAALAYHRCSPKHKEREIHLKRTVPGGEVKLVLLDQEGNGVEQFKCFADSPEESLILPLGSLSKVIRSAEALLRR